jgi:hypothetical protein
LGATQATQMEAKLMHTQVEYHDNWRFWSHSLTSWPKVFEMNFPNSLLRL